MRVLIGLSALASLSLVNGQCVSTVGQTATLTQCVTNIGPTSTTVGQTAVSSSGSGATAAIAIYPGTTASGSTVPNISNSGNLNALTTALCTNTPPTLPCYLPTKAAQWSFSVVSTVTSLTFSVTTNSNTAQMQFRINAPSSTYVCDVCSGTSCDVINGPNTVAGFPCASFTRTYTYGTLLASNYFGVEVFDLNGNPTSFSFSFTKSSPTVSGDPQIVGMQGQDFQVHGMPDEIFNIVTYPTVQVNARFTYLESAECHDNFTACFAHPGTYISEQGFRLGKDKVRITAGSFKKGLQVHVNGKKIKQNVDLKSGAVELVNHRRVIVHTDIMRFVVSNSDKFMNQELELKDDKLIALGAEHKVLKDNERFHPEVPLHGLQGQTWRNVEYASGLDYEGSIMDYHVVDGNLFGTDFVFNQFQA